MEIFYEISYLLKPGLLDSEAGNFARSLEAKIGETGGLIKESAKPFRTELGYPIEGQIHAWNGKVIFGIEDAPEKMGTIKTFTTACSEILRIAYFRTSPKALTEMRERLESTIARSRASREQFSIAAAEKQSAMISSTKNQEIKEEKTEVAMEEIEKKLEELLK